MSSYLQTISLKIILSFEKTRQNAENKQTLDFTVETEISEKTCQTAENKQTFGFTGKIEISEKNSSKR